MQRFGFAWERMGAGVLRGLQNRCGPTRAWWVRFLHVPAIASGYAGRLGRLFQ